MGIVGRNLKAARASAGLRQVDVGEAVGVRAKDVSRWENGVVEPGRENRQRLADLFFEGDVAGLYQERDLEAAA